MGYSTNENVNCSPASSSDAWLAKRGIVSMQLREQLEYVKRPHHLPVSVLTHHQVCTILRRINTSTLTGRRNRTMLEMLYSSGLRAAEILGLDLSHIDLQNRTAFVTGKGDKQRLVPIGVNALASLEDYLLTVRPNLKKQDDDEPALFLNHAGRRYPYHTLNRMVKRSATVLEVPFDVTPHTFRRSCTTELIRAGANLYHVKELLGHENLDTLKHYTRLNIVDIQKTHDKCHPREHDRR